MKNVFSNILVVASSLLLCVQINSMARDIELIDIASKCYEHSVQQWNPSFQLDKEFIKETISSMLEQCKEGGHNPSRTCCLFDVHNGQCCADSEGRLIDIHDGQFYIASL